MVKHKIRYEREKECKEVGGGEVSAMGGGGGGLGSDTIKYLDFSVFSLLSQ